MFGDDNEDYIRTGHDGGPEEVKPKKPRRWVRRKNGPKRYDDEEKDKGPRTEEGEIVE